MSDSDPNNVGSSGSFDISGGDSFTETTSRSWLERIGSSLMGLLIGPLLVLVGIGVLSWNEGRAVGTAKSLTEGAGAVISVSAATVDPGNEGKLVHVTGRVAVAGPVRDASFGITAEGLRLVRKVEAFQWKESSHSETRKKLGGGEETVTTYSYSTDWTEHPVDGASFKQPNGHRNPPVPIAGSIVSAPSPMLGGFALTGGQAGELGRPVSRPVEAGELGGVKAGLGALGPVQLVDGRVFVGDPMHPKVGDLRISFEVAPAGDATVVARQVGKDFAPYTTSNGRTIEILRDGIVPAAQVFADAQSDNAVLTWILRGVGTVVIIVGFGMLVGPLSVIADLIPFVGDIVGAIGGFFAFGAGILVGATTIAVAWFAIRPVLSLGLVAAGLGVAYLMRRFAGQRRPAAAAPRGAAGA